MTDIIEADAVEETALVPHAGGTLIKSENPHQFIEAAADIATALADVVRRQGLTSNIQGKEHARVEAWTLLGSMLGVFPVVEWTRETADGWEARVEARTLAGAVVGAAEAMCSKSEKMWGKRDDYALRSMAQTRATSKALRGPLGFVMTLAGFEATPFEEMPHDSQPQVEPSGPTVRMPGAPSSTDPKILAAEGMKLLTDVDPTILWPEVIAEACELCYGVDRKHLPAAKTKEFWTRFANVAYAVSQTADMNTMPPITDMEILREFAWAFDGAVVTLTRAAASDDLPEFGDQS